MRKLTTLLVTLLLVVFICVGALGFANARGWISVLGIDSNSSDSQVITAVERIQEVALLQLNIQGIKIEDRGREVFGGRVPGTTEKVILQYEFQGKLGIDGSAVQVRKTGENAYRVTVPAFTFIGYDDPTFEVVDEDSGVLSGLTPEIDQVELVNEILNGDARRKYIDTNEELLQEQARTFYETLVTSVDPTAEMTFDFQV